MDARFTPEFTLLAGDEPPPMTIERPDGESPFLLVCDHAGRRIPRKLGSLGLAARHLDRHIAWDIGAAGVARRLSRRLDATLVLQTYSRLVIDCNRSPRVDQSIVTISEDTEIPGNRNLRRAEVDARVREIFLPYHDCIAGQLDARDAAGRTSVLVAVHSFTPVYRGESRPWHIGVLYNADSRLADVLLKLIAEDEGVRVGDNQPYAVGDETDYTIPVHGERRGVVHVEIEIRQDLVASEAGEAEWAERLDGWLTAGLERLRAAEPTL